MKKIVVLFFLCLISSANLAKSQSMVSEITWTDANYITYQGLLVLYPNNRGDFMVKFYDANIGWVWCHQKATLTNQYDAYGNCLSYINCSYPKTSPSVPYSADNFLIYPNGAMYTQDYSGNWSTLITAYVVQSAYWQSKMQEYGLR